MSRIKCSELEINVTNMAENIHFLNDLIAIISFYNEFRLKTSRHISAVAEITGNEECLLLG